MKKFSLYLFFLLLLSCDMNDKNIEGGGVVCDIHNNPIPNAEVLIVCVYDMGVMRDEENSFEKTVYTDSLGQFDFHFEKGFKVKIAVKANGYKIATKIVSTKDDLNLINFTLDERTSNDCILYMHGELSSERKCNGIRNSTYFEGFNISQGEIRNNMEDSDIWIVNNILYVKPSGGTIPIMKKSGNLLIAHEEAPLDGYISSYKITGNEAGYFIKTDQNKYAKIILESRLESTFKGCTEKKYGIRVLYPPDSTTDLSLPHSLDLKSLLLVVH